MPFLTTLIDDKSPLILYDDTWAPGTSADTSAMDYYLGTFTVNNVTNATATFNFNGTQIWLYGAHRPNHGTYTIQLDNESYPNLNGGGANEFQQSLFNTSVVQGSHSLKLTNTGTGSTPYMDIDLIVWQSEIGNAGDQLVHELVQDTDSRFQYQGPAWTTDAPTNTNFNYFYNGTGHSTSTYSASVTFMFTGTREAISLYGTSGPDNGPYSAQLDDGQAVTYNASNIYPTNYAVMLYHADNLGSGSHQLVLTNLPGSSGQFLSIDYAELWTISDGTTTSTSPNVASDPQNLSPNGDLGFGEIGGIVVLAMVAVLCAAAALLFYRRWKAALATQQSFYQVSIPPRYPPESTITPTTGFSSLPETRSIASSLRVDTSARTTLGRPYPTYGYPVLYDRTVFIPPGSRDSRINTPSSPAPSSVADEALGRRYLPTSPGGGAPLSPGFPKCSPGTTGQRASGLSITPLAPIHHHSEAPPNYNQAVGRE